MRNHPSIFQVGRVKERGGVVTIHGWGLGLCAQQCNCHQDPATFQLSIFEDQAKGLLGLIQHRACDCCVPWTADELAGVLRAFGELDAMIPTGVEPVTGGEA